MEEMNIDWKTVLAYAPMSNGRAERMVGTVKRGVSKTVLSSGEEWDSALWKVVYGYRQRRLSIGYSHFELLYVSSPRMVSSDLSGTLPHTGEQGRAAELLALQAVRDTRAMTPLRARALPGPNFSVADEVLVARGTALNTTVKWPAFKSKFYGPCQITAAYHPRHVLLSPSGRISRGAAHARRLVLYRNRSSLLTSELEVGVIGPAEPLTMGI